jgi:serine/threonine protein kinase
MVGRPPIWADETDADHDKCVMSTIVHFSSMDAERFPPDLNPAAVDIISKLLTLDPATRLGSNSGSSDSSGSGAAEVEAHPFFSAAPDMFKWQDAHTLAAPKLVAAPSQGTRPKWTQRSYSMMISPLPQRYTFDAESGACVAVAEGDESDSSWSAVATATASAAASASASGARRQKPRKEPALGVISESVTRGGGDGASKATQSGTSTTSADSIAMPPPSFTPTPFPPSKSSSSSFSPVTIMPASARPTATSSVSRNQDSSDVTLPGRSRTMMRPSPSLNGRSQDATGGARSANAAALGASAVGGLDPNRRGQRQGAAPPGKYTVKGMDLSAG